MLPLIQQLSSTTSKSIQASLVFPTLTSIVLELVHHSLNARPGSFIEVYISLAPEWQITCQHDATDYTLHPHVEGQDSSLAYLSYLGVVDVQTGQYKHIQKAGNVIFSGLLDDALGVCDRAMTSITIRDIFRHLPVRRQAFTSSAFARTELERCRRALSVVTLPHFAVRVTLSSSSLDQAGSKIILDVAKTASLLARYENVFSLPGSVLPILANDQVKQSRVQITGFVVTSLLSSRSHQHILFNGRLQDDTEYCATNAAVGLEHAAGARAVVLAVLEGSYIGSNQSHARDAKSYTASRRFPGYFMDIRVSESQRIDHLQVEAVIRSALSDALRSHCLLPMGESNKGACEHTSLQPGESSPKKLRRGCDSVMLDTACSLSTAASSRQFTLDRGGLLREPMLAERQSIQAGWLHEVLSSWKRTLSADTPVEEGLSALTHGHGCDLAGICTEEDRGFAIPKEGLASSRVIGQVDTKYISIVYEDSLVLIDQHAAHERVRLEAMLSGYWTDCLQRRSDQSHKVRGASRLVDLPNHLARVFEDEDTLLTLSHWGFIITIRGTVQAPQTTIQVSAVPEILEEKLSSDQALKVFVIDLAASLEDEGVRRRLKLARLSLPHADGDNDWVLVLRHLPAPLLDLFSSMSCRGAIMFNDPLTQQQCKELIEQLSRCNFPFQCAHGRPSLSPLSSLRFNNRTTLHPLSPSRIKWPALAFTGA